MLTKRIIACLDIDAGRVVKGTRFLHLRDAGDPAELASAYAEGGADEIVFLDITATHQRRATLLSTVRRTAPQIFVPFTVGGGIGSLEDACAVFDAGADKVTINSAALRTPELISQIAHRFGSQAVIVSVDSKSDPSGEYRVHTHGGRQPTARAVLDWVCQAEQCGAGEVLLTSMDRDGTRSGFDCVLTSAAASTVSIPVIASGGAGSVQHFVEVFRDGSADAALAASIFHFGLHNIRQLKQQLADAGVPVRWPC